MKKLRRKIKPCILHKWYIVNFFLPNNPKKYNRVFHTLASAQRGLHLLRNERCVAIYKGIQIKKYNLVLLTYPEPQKIRGYQGQTFTSKRIVVEVRKSLKERYNDIYKSICNGYGNWQYPPKLYTGDLREDYREHCRKKWKHRFMNLEGMTKNQIERKNPSPKIWWPEHKELIPKMFSRYL